MAALSMLSYTSALAYESPSGYTEAAYVVDWGIDNQQSIALMETSEAYNLDNLDLTACGGYNPTKDYIIDTPLRVVTNSAHQPLRGYIRVMV